MKQKTISASFTKHDARVEKHDLNGYGIMHGGRLLTLCDEVGYLAAKKHAECDCLTRAAHNIQFYSFMKEGEPFSVQARVVLTGKTTMWVECSIKNSEQTVMSAIFVYIAVDKKFKPIAVPAVQAEDTQEMRAQTLMRHCYDQVRAC